MNKPSAFQETPQQDLAQIVKQAQSGDPNAFESLVERTENLLKKISYPIVGERLLSDALQETYLTVFRNLEQLRDPDAFLPWVSRICLHTCYKLHKNLTPTQNLEQEISQPDGTERVDSRLTLQRALNRLERPDRDILILRELLGFSYEELAYTLRLPVGTVKSRLNTARKRLKERLLPS